MDHPTHTIDPEGDVIIVLSNANSPFAPDDHEDTTMKKIPGSDSKSEPSDHDEDQHREKRPRLVGEQPSGTPTEDGHLSETPDEKCFRIQVSGRHLILASPIFSKMLTGTWKESTTYQSKGSVEITAEDWDIEAFLILLRAIHAQQSQIPRKLSLEMLANVAVLINYYDCKDTVSILTEVWINGLNEEIPQTCSREVLLWVWVSQFFKLPSQFKTSTSNIMTYCDGLVTNRGLPIDLRTISKKTQTPNYFLSNIVTESMNVRRRSAIKKILDRLHNTLEELLSGDRGCNFECRSMAYGALTLEMNSANLLSSTLAAPFQGLSYKSLLEKIESFHSPDWDHHHKYNYRSCRLRSLKSLAGTLDSHIEGVDIDRLDPNFRETSLFGFLAKS